MFREYKQIKITLKNQMPFLTDDYIDILSRKICDDLFIKHSNIPPTTAENNFRTVLWTAMVDVYGSYDPNSEDIFGSLIGVESGVIEKILHVGKITEDDFEKICDYLNPTKEIKDIWKIEYVNGCLV